MCVCYLDGIVIKGIYARYSDGKFLFATFHDLKMFCLTSGFWTSKSPLFREVCYSDPIRNCFFKNAIVVVIH